MWIIVLPLGVAVFLPLCVFLLQLPGDVALLPVAAPPPTSPSCAHKSLHIIFTPTLSSYEHTYLQRETEFAFKGQTCGISSTEIFIIYNTYM